MSDLIEFKLEAVQDIACFKNQSACHIKEIEKLKAEAEAHFRRVKILEKGMFQRDQKIMDLKKQMTEELEKKDKELVSLKKQMKEELGMIAQGMDDIKESSVRFFPLNLQFFYLF